MTPIVLIGTYVLGQKLPRIPPKTLNITISPDMSVCGVLAAIATRAVAAAGELLGERALHVATTIKIIQNVLIGVALSVWPPTGASPIDRSTSHSNRIRPVSQIIRTTRIIRIDAIMMTVSGVTRRWILAVGPQNRVVLTNGEMSLARR